MIFTTASGAKFSCGDGTGEPVTVRFLTRDAERRVLLNPELALGEVYMEGSFVVEQDDIRRPSAACPCPSERKGTTAARRCRRASSAASS